MSNLQVRAKSIFLNALEIEELERVSYVENQCGNNELLNREVVALLDHAQRLGRFLATNAEKGFTPLDQANFDSHGRPWMSRTGSLHSHIAHRSEIIL